MGRFLDWLDEKDIADEFSAGLNVFLHFAVLGVLTIVSGRPFLFPSLGPSAYLMATGEQPRAEGAYHVIGGHTVAVVGGMIAYSIFVVEGASTYEVFQQPDPAFSQEIVVLTASASVAMVITTVVMLVTKTNHPAACATTLIIALGLMGGLVDAIVIITAVTLLTVMHEYVIAPMAKYYGFRPEDPR